MNMDYTLHRFESFKPRQLDVRKETPQGKQIEAEKQIRKAKVEQLRKKYEFESGKPVLASKLADKIDGWVILDGDLSRDGLSWKIECDELNNPYAVFAIYFSIEPEEEIPGFQIVDIDGNYVYQGEDVERAYSAMEKRLDEE